MAAVKKLFHGQSDMPVLELLAVRPRLFMFDFDGTLAALAATPGQANLSAEMKNRLRTLSRQSQTTVAVISGRELHDLKARVDLPGLVYIGNHGLSSSKPEFRMSADRVRKWKSAARQAERLLAPLAQKYSGCLLENKGVDVSLHYRLVDARQKNALIREARARVRHLPLAAKTGKEVLEFRPVHGGDKGQAVKKLASNLARGWKQTGCCVYVGDDSTDEDAFKAIRKLGKRAVAVKVGGGTTRAHYRLFGQEEMGKLVKLLVGANNDKK